MTNHNSNKFESGFTLIEIISVLIILSILAVIVVSRMDGTGISIYGDADRLVADLRYAQSLAMTHGYKGNGTVDKVTVDIQSNKWNIHNNGTKNWRFADGKTKRKLKWADSINGPSSISFGYPFGKLETNNGENKNITLSKGSKTITVTVYAKTGYVEINK